MRADNVAAALNDPPDWLGSFGAYLVGRHHPSRACAMLTRLGKRLADNTTAVHPQTLLESIDADVPLMRALEDFLTANKLALPPDRDERRAAARRQSRIDVVPAPLRPAVAGFAAYLLTGRDRARRTGTHPRGHATLEARLGAVRDFAQFLTTHRGKSDWATVEVGDIEAFLHARPSRRAYYLAGLRQFCRHAARRRVMLINPTSGLKAPQTMAFRGPTLPADQQRALFRRWSTDHEVHPHEAFVGLAALLHGATTHELQHLTDADIDHDSHRIRLGRRPHPTPLDPWTWTALQRCIGHRGSLGSNNSHLLITLQTKATRAAGVGQLRQEHVACGRHPTPDPALHAAGRPRQHGRCQTRRRRLRHAQRGRHRLPRRSRRHHSPAEPVTLQVPPRTGSRELVRFCEVLDERADRPAEPRRQGRVLRGV